MDYRKYYSDIVFDGEYIMHIQTDGIEADIWRWKGKYICFDNSDKTIQEADIYELSRKEVWTICSVFAKHHIKFGGF